MAMAKKCDICKHYFDDSDGLEKNNVMILGYKPMGMEQIKNKKKFDICPECDDAIGKLICTLAGVTEMWPL